MPQDVETGTKDGKNAKTDKTDSPSISPLVIGVGAFIVGALVAFGITYGAVGSTEAAEAEEVEAVISEFDDSMNYCSGTKPTAGFDNAACVADGVVTAVEQAGGNVTLGWQGARAHNADPINGTLKSYGLCPVNVHWHLGAEHLSVGEYDEDGTGPDSAHRRRLLAEDARLGGQCHFYDGNDAKFTTEYDWEHCVGMHVGETYEVHWPHSNMGACNTPWQYQTPFYDGVFCNMLGGANPDGDIPLVLEAQNVANQVGVQSQVYTIVNDEDYYDPNMLRGMLVKDMMGQEMGQHITAYTGSTTGTSRDNEICSAYAPITWHVDRKCHMISASSFDKMCKDMKSQPDDMSDDLYAHGSREVVSAILNADNQFDLTSYHDVQ